MANFLSKALLSLVMDKSARETMERRQEVKKRLKNPEAYKKKKATKEAAHAPQDQKKKATESPPIPRHDRPLKGVTPEEEQIAALLAQKIATAEDSIADRIHNNKSRGGERSELITNALRIQRAKADVFKNLSDEEFRKLQGLAQKLMLGGAPKDR